MAHNNKILILYATAGIGHKKAAEAVFQEAKNRSLDAELLDINDFMPVWAKRLYEDGYTLLITRLVRLWGSLYFLSDTPFLKFLNGNFRRFMNALALRRLARMLKDTESQAVISTHFLASEIVSYAKAKFGIKTRLINVITDFGVHNFWLAPGTDIYCCASPQTRDILVKKGVGEERIKVTGIPVHEKFIRTQDVDKLRSDFKLSKDILTVLVVTGGIGAGPIEKIVDLLDGEVQVMVVCGRNKKLYARLVQKKQSRLRVFGFVDYMEKLMAVSDVIVTKAGGLTVTESLAMGLPMIFFFLVPGQETINAKTLESSGAGLIASTPRAIRESVLKFKNDPLLLASYRPRVLSLAKPHASAEIVSLLKH